MFGFGPGALTADAYKMGIPIPEQRRMMNEAIDVLVPLKRGDGVIFPVSERPVQGTRGVYRARGAPSASSSTTRRDLPVLPAGPRQVHRLAGGIGQQLTRHHHGQASAHADVRQKLVPILAPNMPQQLNLLIGTKPCL